MWSTLRSFGKWIINSSEIKAEISLSWLGEKDFRPHPVLPVLVKQNGKYNLMFVR